MRGLHSTPCPPLLQLPHCGRVSRGREEEGEWEGKRVEGRRGGVEESRGEGRGGGEMGGEERGRGGGEGG